MRNNIKVIFENTSYKKNNIRISNENDIILDPFAGSGTTPYIAQKYNRNFIAIEKEAKYFNAIANRLSQLEQTHKIQQKIKSSKKNENKRVYGVNEYEQKNFVFTPSNKYSNEIDNH